MPELPEVNAFKNYFDEAAIGRTIREVVVLDNKIFRNTTAENFAMKLENRQFVGSYRRGKYLFCALDDGNHILLHFGMTGDLKYYNDSLDAPKHERFRFEFSDNMKLGFDCPRKFARIDYIEDLEAYIAQKNLGPDALEISEHDFLAAMSGKSGTIKGFLLNQKVLSGMGNLYADEVLYQTRVHPLSITDRISTKKKKEIYRKMIEVLTRAVEENPDYKEYPEDWFWKWRVEGTVGPAGKGKVTFSTIAGRTTYYCNAWQRKYT